MKSTKVTKAAREIVRTPHGSRDASNASRREGLGGARPSAAATTTAERTARTKTSSDAPGSAVVAKRRSVRRVGYICPPCGRFIATEVEGMALRAQRGSPPRFCSPGCRQAAYRRRRAGVSEEVRLQIGGGRDRSLKRSAKASSRSRRKTNA